MKLEFYKYQGTGNDFIMIDNRRMIFDPGQTALVKKLCDRRFGIGGDGLILLETDSRLDFRMVYFNSDGNQSSMCGNGGRCIVQFAHDLGVIQDKTTFMAVDGLHDAFLKGGLVHLKMIDVLEVEKVENDFYLNTGSPHYVQFVNEVEDFPVYAEGYKIRNNDRFRKEGTNVNFVQKLDQGHIVVRTYERGVEDETYSCGTGVTAAAVAASLSGIQPPVRVKTLGGDLQVDFQEQDGKFSDVYLSGPAQQVFQGHINV